jgi:hypothetical protein
VNRGYATNEILFTGVISDDVLISEAHQQLAVEKTGIWCSSKLAHRLSGVKLSWARFRGTLLEAHLRRN